MQSINQSIKIQHALCIRRDGLINEKRCSILRLGEVAGLELHKIKVYAKGLTNKALVQKFHELVAGLVVSLFGSKAASNLRMLLMTQETAIPATEVSIILVISLLKTTAMDDLARKFENIEADLWMTRRTLLILDKNAQSSIRVEVDSMRNAIASSNSKIQLVSSNIQDFLKQIDDTVDSEDDTRVIYLKPQMAWLNTNLDDIVSELKIAQSRSDAALGYASDYTYQVMDVGQEVEMSKSSLIDAKQDSKLLASEAQSELRTSETLLAATKSKITRNKQDSRIKAIEAEAKTSRKRELETEISAKNREISAAEQAHEKKKKHVEYKSQIKKIGETQSEFSSLQDIASSITSRVTEAQCELQQITQMDECSGLLVEKTLEV